MGASYRQFCPVAKAMELLDERWTMLVVRELVAGSRHFNELRRGLPRMSPTLLSKRLQTLVRAGVVERWEDGNRVTYRLSESGKELEPIVVALGQWGIRWISELGDEDLDPHLLLWDIRRGIDTEAVPDGRTVIGFVFPDGDIRGNPFHYRDARTNGMLEKAFALVPREQIFEQTGVQFMQLNSLYQLLAR